MEKNIKAISGLKGQKLLDAIKVRSLLIHEITHFLDTTTSVWGLEYTYRKARLIRAIELNQQHEQPLSVFHLNTAELDSHLSLLTNSREGLSGSILKHKIDIDDVFGPVLSMLYFRNNEEIHQLPISMLALLEGHATANEFLRRLKDIESLKGDERIVAMRIAETEFSDHLDDSRLTEYSALLYLTRIHFPELSLRHLLRLFCAITTFTLNVSGLDIARIANRMGFQNPIAGPTLAQDMRRGGSRQIIAFKLIIALSNWTKEDGEEYVGLLQSDPYRLIVKFFKIHFDHKLINAVNLELIPLLNWLKPYNKWYPDFEIFSESISYNRWRILKKPIGEHEFSELKLMSIILNEDGSAISFPNRSKYDSLKIFENYLPVMSKLENMMRNNPSKKFFMPYEAIPSYML